MNTISTAKEIGLRCKRLRNALGLSQDALGEKVGILGATISKYEREGIYDIEKIQELSNALGHDLLSDEVDQEGVIGEVGKEILYILIQNNGYRDYEFVSNNMYGMSSERVSKEIFKLERIGMCVREQYKDWHENDKDIVFITAKGIISLKNAGLDQVLLANVYDKLPSVTSYEGIIGEFGSYQDFIDNNPAERIIRKLANEIYGMKWWDLWSDYEEIEDDKVNTYMRRLNYIKYLYDNYTSELYRDEIDDLYDHIIPSRGIYHDILYRMALGHTNKYIFNEYLTYEPYCLSDECSDIYVKVNELIKQPRDFVVERALADFREDFADSEEFRKECFPEIEAIQATAGFSAEIEAMALDVDELSEYYITKVDELFNKYINKSFNEFCADNEQSQLSDDLIYQLESLNDAINDGLGFLEHEDLDPDVQMINYNSRRPQGKSYYPVDWFSEDEIRSFVNENFGSAVTEEDKRIDEELKEVNRLIPDSLDYYEMPESWKKNGLAKLIRENFGITPTPAEEG